MLADYSIGTVGFLRSCLAETHFLRPAATYRIRRPRFLGGKSVMEISNTRFGAVRLESEDILVFPQGLIGFETCQHWMLLADIQNSAVAWLQSLSLPEVALGVVSPRRFVPHYQLQVSAEQLETLEIGTEDELFVLTILGQEDGHWTVNLKAPIVINLASRRGRQMIAQDDQPLQLRLSGVPPLLRKAA